MFASTSQDGPYRRLTFHVQGWSVKRIVRELHVSRSTVRKILRSSAPIDS
ncbi:plasmid maintenance system antidote protein VapI [Rhizobium sp. SLBN-94]|nr:plasmid maintenance system antidote protein VapI [Rhizobium sp. SLBN-94]